MLSYNCPIHEYNDHIKCPQCIRARASGERRHPRYGYLLTSNPSSNAANSRDTASSSLNTRSQYTSSQANTSAGPSSRYPATSSHERPTTGPIRHGPSTSRYRSHPYTTGNTRMSGRYSNFPGSYNSGRVAVPGRYSAPHSGSTSRYDSAPSTTLGSRYGSSNSERVTLPSFSSLMSSLCSNSPIRYDRAPNTSSSSSRYGSSSRERVTLPSFSSLMSSLYSGSSPKRQLP